jgi:ribosomal protein S27AE
MNGDIENALGTIMLIVIIILAIRSRAQTRRARNERAHPEMLVATGENEPRHPASSPTMDTSARSVTLDCPGCGAALEVAPTHSQLACGSCGKVAKVERRGGTIVLLPKVAATERVQHVGTDKSAASKSQPPAIVFHGIDGQKVLNPVSVIIFLVALVAGILGLVAYMATHDAGPGAGSSPSAASPSPPPLPSKLDAWVSCQEFVEKRLKAPSSADFPFFDKNFVTDLGGGAFHVQAYVDAQNSFGAKLRSDFTCDVHDTGDTWYLDAVDIKTR